MPDELSGVPLLSEGVYVALATAPHGFAEGKDICLSMFGDVWATGRLDFPLGARVLEIGCAEADWMTPMLAARPDVHITGIDWRACERPGTVIRGDVLTHDFPEASFDVVVGVSSIEHIGLGHYNGDPLDDLGDQHCMERVARWLKPGGWVYLDVPYAEDGFQVVGTEYRAYDEAAVATRLLPKPGLRCTWWARCRAQKGGLDYVVVVGRKDS